MRSYTGEHKRFWTSPVAFIGSLCIHALIIWLCMLNLNAIGQTGDFGTDEVYREVGITYEERTQESEEEVQEETSETEVTEEVAETEELPKLPESVQESPLPKMKALPDLSQNSLIGPGPSEPMSGSSSPELSQLSRQLPKPVETKAGIPSTTKFFDIATRGEILVYVIDCSGSMSRNNAFRYAKAELTASLERLKSNHKFHVIFYNENIHEFKGRDGKTDVSWATASNLSQCRAFVSAMDNTSGTAHAPALKRALSYNPDVIFFLTDGAKPEMSAKQLDEIQRTNRGRTAIHCIEFGIQSPDLKLPNFLQKLSHENGGTYRYRDTNEFQ